MLSRNRSVAPWWEHAVFYEIAPLSFQDTDADGKGDLKGIENRIDYLQWLGIDAVWLTPFFTSPMLDFGYDIADYCAVDPVFGTLEDFDRLLEAPASPRNKADPRLRAQPHLRSAFLVPR
jgi:alpha-glucosidase